jgi:trimethylamine--corrinoid protein Co-methyltransferase
MAKIISNQHAQLSPFAKKLSNDQSRKLYWACLEILERTGVCLYEQQAIDLLKNAGAEVTDGNRVRIPSGMVEKPLIRFPKMSPSIIAMASGLCRWVETVHISEPGQTV